MELCFFGDTAPSPNSIKVLISMHPIDRYIYFDKLAAGILKAENIAVCFSSAPLDTETTDFENVDVVIVAVTEKYITWNNSGFVSEGLAAKQRGVPVLPIMLEPGIANLFNTRFGKIHYIENLSTDFSDENLSHIVAHISSVKTETAVEQDISKPKIFISYRKRDSHELKRLVSLISSHPLCEKVSLWYDTNLNPGDNYSNEIMTELKSCDLFLLLVTPNLLEENNYVMRIEYPEARTQKKHILPIIMQKTDLTRLNELFPRLPKCITANQVESIFSKLL